jgi:uncharacterized membrane protein
VPAVDPDSTSLPRRSFSPFDPRSAIGRLVLALIVAAGVVAIVRAFAENAAVIALAGWDSGGLAWLSLAWFVTADADAIVTRARAGAEDPGRRAAYLIVILGSFASLLAATLLSRHLKAMAFDGDRTVLISLCFAAVAIAWLLAHTAFTLRYAHLYYREDSEGVGGVEFSGSLPPSYLDFAYLAFTIGMCFQVSDMSVSSPQIRRTVLAHAMISFAFNSVLLAFVLNLVFGAVG